MNLSQLRFVAAVAQTGSFSRAAERCTVTQPTLSNGIAQLEDELGGRVFERTTRRVSLTPFGRHLLPLIRAVVEARDELEKAAAAYLNPAHKLIRIGLSPLIDTALLTAVLDPYRRRHPDVEVFFKECFLGDLAERLDEEKLDIVLWPVDPDRPGNGHTASQPFYEESLCYLPRSAHPGEPGEGGPGESGPGESGAVRLQAIAGETFALTQDGCGLAPATRRLFRAQGFALREYAGQALGYQVLQDWAELGIAAAILPERKLAPDHRPRARPVLLDQDRPAMLRYEGVWKRTAVRPGHVAALLDHFRETMPKLLPGVAA